MHRAFARRRLLALLLLAPAESPCSAQNTVDAKRMDEVVRFYADDSGTMFMGAVLVARGGEVLFAKGYGLANAEWNIPNTPTTKFGLASISKQFTAAAILLLEERGKLRVSDRITSHLPDAPAAWGAITFHHLLSHTSGMADPPIDRATRALPARPEQIVGRFRNSPLQSAPGTAFRYSNAGYQLLAHLIERISGQRYEDFVRESIFEPLGMKDSGSDSPGPIIASRASGYVRNVGGSGALLHAPLADRTNGIGAGSLYSTVGDLHRWTIALFGGTLLSVASLTKMTTVVDSAYAYGLAIGTADGRRRMSHGGRIPGFASFLTYYPESQVTVAVLTNSTSLATPGQRPAPLAVADWLGTLAHGGRVTLPANR
jgi:CubicO group peptidase (beta-lactamase class C family)